MKPRERAARTVPVMIKYYTRRNLGVRRNISTNQRLKIRQTFLASLTLVEYYNRVLLAAFRWFSDASCCSLSYPIFKMLLTRVCRRSMVETCSYACFLFFFVIKEHDSISTVVSAGVLISV
jgi:hypothetical protein